MTHMQAIESTMSFLGYDGDIQTVDCRGSVDFEDMNMKTGDSQ